MSTLYLIRHGQAGSRDHYDQLSETGQRQAVLLGRHFRASGVRFDAAYSGSLERQRQTAALVLEALPGAPEVRVDPRWNEFDLDSLWKKLAPRLIATDEEFARNYERLHRNNPGIDRVMTVCDIELIRTWTRETHPCNGLESWSEFRRRVEAPLAGLAGHGPDEVIAVFTSATPLAVWSGMALGLDVRGIFRILGVLMNSNYSTFRLRGQELSLLSLNNTPHLTDPALRTLR